MNGHVISNTPIAVDFWKVRQCPTAKIFFLSHLHGDHIAGLSSSWQHKIYCSEVTGKLLIEKYDVAPSLIFALETGRNYIIHLDQDEKEQMTVLAVDANHCPGAVIFLFEGYFGKILYTGDFRWGDQVLRDLYPCNLNHLDLLYLDNTYCSPRCEFPTRDVATGQLLTIVKDHPDHDIVIGMRSLGKEDILLRIAGELKEWISLPGDLYTTACILGLPNIFCVNDVNCRIRVEPFYSISNKNMDRWNERRPTIAILPTALYTGLDMSPFVNREDVYIVPYSDHSSFTELLDFVKFVKPKTIYPIVSGDTRGPFGVDICDRADMSCFTEYLNKEPRMIFEVPSTVKKWMSVHHRQSPQRKRVQKRKRKPPQKQRKNSANGVVFDHSSSEEEEEEGGRKNEDKKKAEGEKSKTKEVWGKVPVNVKPLENGLTGEYLSSSEKKQSNTSEEAVLVISDEENENTQDSSPSVLVSSFSHKVDSPLILSESKAKRLSPLSESQQNAKRKLFPSMKSRSQGTMGTEQAATPSKTSFRVIPINSSQIDEPVQRKAPSVKALPQPSTNQR